MTMLLANSDCFNPEASWKLSEVTGISTSRIPWNQSVIAVSLSSWSGEVFAGTVKAFLAIPGRGKMATLRKVSREMSPE